MQAKKPLKIVVLISGNGSNLQAIIDAIQHKQLHAKIVCVIANRSDAFGLQRARKADLIAKELLPENFINLDEYERTLAEHIWFYQADLVVLAGFMKILSDSFVKIFRGQIINIHPSLLPKYPGLNTHKKVLENGEKKHGCTIHFVTEQIDAGPIIASKSLDVFPNDTEETLQQRVQQLEHALYPQVLQWFAENRLHLANEGIVFDKPLEVDSR